MTRTFICPVCRRLFSTDRNTFAWICSNCHTFVDEYTTSPADERDGSPTIIFKGDGFPSKDFKKDK